MREMIGQEPQNRIRKYIRRTADTAAGAPINGSPFVRNTTATLSDSFNRRTKFEAPQARLG